MNVRAFFNRTLHKWCMLDDFSEGQANLKTEVSHLRLTGSNDQLVVFLLEIIRLVECFFLLRVLAPFAILPVLDLG